MKPSATSRSIMIAALAAALAPLVWHLLGLAGGADAQLGLVGRHGGHFAESQLAWAWIALTGGYALLAFSALSAAPAFSAAPALSAAPAFSAASAFAAAEPGRRERGGDAAGRRWALGAALGVAALGAAALAIGWPPFGVLAACALGLAALRLSTGRTAASPRGALVEGAAFFASLWLSQWLARAFGAGPLGFAASVWGFFLVQSLCLALVSRPRAPGRGGDAFEAARRRLESLLADDRS